MSGKPVELHVSLLVIKSTEKIPTYREDERLQSPHRDFPTEQYRS